MYVNLKKEFLCDRCARHQLIAGAPRTRHHLSTRVGGTGHVTVASECRYSLYLQCLRHVEAAVWPVLVIRWYTQTVTRHLYYNTYHQRICECSRVFA